MKALLLTALLTVASTPYANKPAAGDQLKLIAQDQAVATIVDATSLKTDAKNPNVKTVLALILLNPKVAPQEPPVTMVTFRIDCQKKMVTPLVVDTYDLKDHLLSHRENLPEQSVLPRSPAFIVGAYVCTHVAVSPSGKGAVTL